MKLLVAFVALIAGISALPNLSSSFASLKQIDLKDERLIGGAVAEAVQGITQGIQDAGLDPLHIPSESLSYALPVPVLLSLEAGVEEFLFTGLSNIVINSADLSVLLLRLTLDLELPRMQASFNNAGIGVVLFGNEFSASAAGRVAISRIRIRVTGRVSIGIISGISINNLNVDFTLGGVESALRVNVQNSDFSNTVNTLLHTTIPNTLNEYSAEVNELLEIIIKDIIDDLL